MLRQACELDIKQEHQQIIIEISHYTSRCIYKFLSSNYFILNNA